jgi:hypothetical protein
MIQLSQGTIVIKNKQKKVLTEFTELLNDVCFIISGAVLKYDLKAYIIKRINFRLDFVNNCEKQNLIIRCLFIQNGPMLNAQEQR